MDTHYSECLSQIDQGHISAQLEKFIVGLRSSEVIAVLLRIDNFFTKEQRRDLNSKRKNEEKAEYLLKQVIILAKYWHLEKFITALRETGHGPLADSLRGIMITGETARLTSGNQTFARQSPGDNIATHSVIGGYIGNTPTLNGTTSSTTRSSQDAKWAPQGIHQNGEHQTGFAREVLRHSTEMEKHYRRMEISTMPPTMPNISSSKTPQNKEGNGNTLDKQGCSSTDGPKSKHSYKSERIVKPDSNTQKFHKGSKEKHQGQSAQQDNRPEVYNNNTAPALQSQPTTSNRSNRKFRESFNSGLAGTKVQPQGQEDLSVVITRPKTGLRKTVSPSRPIQKHSRFKDPLHNQQAKIFDIVKDKERIPFDFYQLLIQFKDKGHINLANFRDSSRLTILHTLVQLKRIDFLEPLVLTGFWGELSRMTFENENGNHMTARDMAVQMEDEELLREITRLDNWEHSLSNLMRAIRSGTTEEVNELLSQPDQINYIDTNDTNACYWAVVKGDLKLLELLDSKQVDIQMITRTSQNLLHIACNLGHNHIITPLFQLHELDPGVKDSNGMTALDRLAQCGNVAAMDIFRDMGVMPQGNTLTTSAFYGQIDVLKYLVDKAHMDVNTRNSQGYSAIQMACMGDRVNIFRYLHESGGDCTMCTPNGENILHIIAKHNSKKSLEYILYAVGDRTIAPNNQINAQKRFDGEELCNTAQCPRSSRERNKWCILEVDRHKLLQFKLKQKRNEPINPHDFGKEVKTGRGLVPTQEDLAKIKKDYAIKRVRGDQPLDMSPLHVAIVYGHNDVAERFIELNADLTIRDIFGLTPLLLAVASGNTRITQRLLHIGVDSLVVTRSGENCLQLAKRSEVKELIQFFEEESMHQFVKDAQKDLQIIAGVNSLDRPQFQREQKPSEKVQALRNLHTKVVDTLKDIGKGPIMQETEGPSNDSRRPRYHTS